MTDMDLLIETNKQLMQTTQLQAEQIQLLTEQVAYLTAKLFGKSKETIDPSISGQLSLFDGQKQTTSVAVEKKEPDTIVKSHKRKKIGRKQAILAELPAEEVHHRLEGEACQCPNCEQPLKEIGASSVKEEVVFIPARLHKNVHVQHAYKCESCSLEKDKDLIIKAPVPKQPIGNSFGSASVIAETIHQKYELKVPGYRQEKGWAKLNLPISRSNIADWHIKITDYYLADFYQFLKHHLIQQDVLHCDETSYRVIESETAKTYYWVAQSSKHHNQQVVLYHHHQSRGGQVIKDYLKGYKGYVHCDMWSAYPQLPNATLVGCFAHVRRKFYDAIPQQKMKETPFSVLAVDKIDALFQLEQEWADLSIPDRLEKRQKVLKPALEEFFEWIGTIDALPKSILGKAIEYALKYKQHFMTILEDGRLELSNNRAERAIKTLVMGRKNWLFSATFEGARATAHILSILETAKANGLDTQRYMQYLLETLPQLPTTKNPELLEAYLPWHPEIQSNFKL